MWWICLQHCSPAPGFLIGDFLLYLSLDVFLFLMNSGGCLNSSSFFFSLMRLLTHFSFSLCFLFSSNFSRFFFPMASFLYGEEDAAGNNACSGDWSYDSCDPSPCLVVEYIERYGTGWMVRDVLQCVLRATYAKFGMSTQEICVTPPLAPGYRGGDTEMGAMRPTGFVNSVKKRRPHVRCFEEVRYERH